MGSGGSRASGGAPVTHVTELAAIIQPIIGAAATIQPIIQIIESAPDAGSRAPSCLEKRLARRACFACSFGYLMNTPAAVFSSPISGQGIFGDELLPYWSMFVKSPQFVGHICQGCVRYREFFGQRVRTGVDGGDEHARVSFRENLRWGRCKGLLAGRAENVSAGVILVRLANWVYADV